MKIREYLQESHDTTLSEYEKFSLYEKILSSQKGNQQQFRYLFSMKQIAYFSILSFLLIGIYGTYFLNSTWDERAWIVISRLQDSVRAWHIAKVVEFTGDFHIEQWEKILKTNTINNNDMVILKEGTTITFSVIDGSTIKMIGPAIFSISKHKNTPYRLYIQDGAFTSIHNNQEEQNMEVIVKDNVTIKTSQEHTDFQITKKGKEYFVNNKGNALKVSTTKEKNKPLQKDKVLTIRYDNDISTIQDKQQFASAISTKDISQSFDLNIALEDSHKNIKQSVDKNITNKNTPLSQKEEFIHWSWVTLTDQKTGWEKKHLQGTPTVDLDSTAVEKILTADRLDIDVQAIDNLLDEKKVFTDTQHTQINKTLNPFFLKSDSKSMLTYHLLWDQEKKNIILARLQKKIIGLGDVFELEMDKNNSLSAITTNIATIKHALKNNYYAPDQYLISIDRLTAWIEKIENTEFGSVDDVDSAEKQTQDIIK